MHKQFVKDFQATVYKYVNKFMGRVLFEFNDAITRAHVQGNVEAWIDQVTDDTNYKVVCDETNNPPEVVDNYGLVVDVYYGTWMNLGKWCEYRVWVTGFSLKTTGMDIE